jgi:hypothetical protein
MVYGVWCKTNGEPLRSGSPLVRATKKLPLGEFFCCQTRILVRIVLVAMNIALQHWATAHPHSPHKLEICGGPY